MTSQFKTLAELASITPGFSPKPNERRETGRYLLLGGRNIKDGRLVKTSADAYVDEIDRESFRRAIARPGDIIVSTLFDRRKLYQYAKNDPRAVVNSSCAIIRAGPESDYIVSYLRTLTGQRDFLDKAADATSGALIPRLSVSSLARIEIPILPVAELARLGDASIQRASTEELEAIKEVLESKRPLLEWSPTNIQRDTDRATARKFGLFSLDVPVEALRSQKRISEEELRAIKADLESKDAEIVRLRAENQRLEQFYEDRIRAVTQQLETNNLARRIKHGETATLEFKSTLRWNIKAQKNDPEIENAVLKTIVAFCNTSGGELLVGVSDDKSILGIGQDGFPNDDRFQLHLRNLLVERITPNVADLVKFEMVVIDGKAICHVTCNQSKKRGIWLRTNNAAQARFYVCVGPSSTELAPPEAVEYIIGHLHNKG